MPIIHLSLILLRSNPPLKTLITCERVNSFEWQTLIKSLNNHTLSYQEGEFSSQVKFMPKYTYVQYTTRWAYYSHELFWIESQSVAITLGSFDNLKQELMTVDFRAVRTYRDVEDFSLPNFVKDIKSFSIRGKRICQRHKLVPLILFKLRRPFDLTH